MGGGGVICLGQGRPSLIPSVLRSNPLCFLFFCLFEILVNVADEIEKSMRGFMGRVVVRIKKYLVKWEKRCACLKIGSIGVVIF